VFSSGAPTQAKSEPAGDQEIVWLQPATSGAAWERLITGMTHAEKSRTELGLRIDVRGAFPDQSAAIPELAIRRDGYAGTLWLRWYKQTGKTGTEHWVQELVKREPPPLAIIGGGSTDRALELARNLERLRTSLAAPPLLFITTATADRVSLDKTQDEDLMAIYPGRSFRFCFTNSQMARAVTHFIWSQPELKPKPGPIYLASWKDDPYSIDLVKRFRAMLWPDEPPATGQPLADGPPWSTIVVHSVGGFLQPNAWEAEGAEQMMEFFRAHEPTDRTLVLLPASVQSARRFLRALMRIAPTEVERFVVATGDSIDFNSIYRDRLLAWPIQDLPFTLVSFSHRNPVEQTLGFRAQTPLTPNAPGGSSSSTSTEESLLYSEIVETVAETCYRDGRLIGTADAWVEQLRKSPRFDARGNRPSAAGEYLIWLKPLREDKRVLPRARLQVFRSDASVPNGWRIIDTLEVDYQERSSAAGRVVP
jgi:hypothetical protein